MLRTSFGFLLPCVSTLNYVTCNWSLSDGLDENVFRALKTATTELTPRERLVVLLMDEMALEPNLTYDKKNDKVIGINDHNENGVTPSKYVLTFMVSLSNTFLLFSGLFQ